MAANVYQIASRTEPLKKPKLDNGVIEEAGTMEILESNFEEEMIASMTEPRLKKPKLDDGVIEEAVTMDPLESRFVEQMGKQIFGLLLSEVCKLALAHRQGESYKFEDVEYLSRWSTSNISNRYQLQFCSRDLNAVGYPRKHLTAFFSSGFKDKEGNCKVLKCVLLTDKEITSVVIEKLTLVDSDNDEVDAFECLYSGPVYDSDFDLMEENLEPELGFPLVELCTSALRYYHEKHPGDCYKLDYDLERGLKEFRASSYGYKHYNLEFLAKSMTEEGNPIRKKFEAGLHFLDWDKPEEFVVKKCLLVKDGEVVPNWSKDCESDSTPPKYILEKESAKYDEFCISCLDFYKEYSGGCYEFVQRLTTSRQICEGVRYVFVFHAKQPGSSKPIKFVASGYNKRRVIEPYRCELIEDQDSVLD